MSVIPFGKDRRRRRSSNTYEAITYQLDYILREQGLVNFALGDSRGLLLATAGDMEDSHVLAAYAPVVAKCTDKMRYYDVVERIGNFIPEANLQTLAYRSFEVDGEVLHLCLLGEAGKLNQVSIYRAVCGVRRILDETRAAA